jgi:hypothetical protein
MTVKAEPAGDHVIDTTFTNLTSFEKWVITRIRESNGDGISFSAWLKGLKERCEFLEGRHFHHKRILAEIHFYSQDLD